jgi:uncharacterized repeat protein (TIGR01451 family)
MKKSASFAVVVLLSATFLSADISVTDRQAILPAATKAAVHKPGSTAVPPMDLAARRAANKAKHDAKKGKRATLTTGRIRSNSLHTGINSTGSISLIDAGGLKYFIDTFITFSTTSSASGAASEASFTGPIVASTSAGGTTTSTLSDMFDGYNGLCVSLTNASGPCQTGNASYTFYNQIGSAASFDATVPATPACTNRQITLPVKTIGPLSVTRKVFVPTNDRYLRWINFFTNTSGAPVTFTMVTGNNLGSDSNTRIVSSSSGDAVAQTTDTWVSTFQKFSGTTSSDPRIGHVLQGAGALTPVSNISFADGDDNPYWTYSITLAPGQTKSIVNFVTGQGTKALANAQAAALAQLPATSTQCMSATELTQVANFVTSADMSIIKTSTPAGSVNPGAPFSYNLSVTNNGPGPATSVSVVDVLPAGVVFNNASGIGWTCGQLAGTVTCTAASLPVSTASPITINVTAPNAAVTLSGTATVSSATTDMTLGNNSSTHMLNVLASADLSISKSTAAAPAYGSNPVTYTLAVSNLGPTAATLVSVADVLPAGATFISATGTGWTCSFMTGTVTCTAPSLAVGAAPPISLVIGAPSVATPGTLMNTATISSAAPDSVPGNNSSTSSAPIVPASFIPTLSGWMLALLATGLGLVVVFRRS